METENSENNYLSFLLPHSRENHHNVKVLLRFAGERELSTNYILLDFS